jgi:hypothetical protein
MPHSAARTNIQIHLAIIRHSLSRDPRIHNRGRATHDTMLADSPGSVVSGHQKE